VEEIAAQRGQVRPRFYHVPDVSRWSRKFLIAKCILMTMLIVIRTRPDVIVTTGAAPGVFALLAGAPLGAKRIWIDSIANAQEVSLSGCKARHVATLWLTQWPQLANDKTGPEYRGSVI
jgi:hypothetical protein